MSAHKEGCRNNGIESRPKYAPLNPLLGEVSPAGIELATMPPFPVAPSAWDGHDEGVTRVYLSSAGI